jgi:hypothetical protein
MRIALTRSGGFAGITLRRELDTATLPPHQRAQIEQLLKGAQEGPASPDAFSYEITAGGETFPISDESAMPLLESLLRG